MKRIFGILFLYVVVLSGCTGESRLYSGIEKSDIVDISNVKNIEFIYQYKGHTENWAAHYIVFKMKDNDNHTSKMLLKYIGKKPGPTGELRYAYQTEGGGDGSGTMSNAESENQIYNLGSSGGNGAIAAEDSIVKMQVYWNGNTEDFELKPEMNQ
ncbi:hypothetical protein [Cohnella luojiensis]|uniref:Uncharacterized protein n=1 Tax=Cohnella luojiensis TaxID=652876 RepID=A0A4Y8LW93_9BACL|nr:hypothetical protein [Cohnella luojiensis]TFE25242.1 hypothetical protein E2980_14440 [Cohnella luojiensis]